jgi:uncharacterized membrane protein YidH (DUF202 family)
MPSGPRYRKRSRVPTASGAFCCAVPAGSRFRVSEARTRERRRAVGIIFLAGAVGRLAALFSAPAVKFSLLGVGVVVLVYGLWRFIRALRGPEARAERRQAIIGAGGAVVAIAVISGLILAVGR